MKQISIAEVRRLMPPGTIFQAVPLASHLKVVLFLELRSVVRNTSKEIESVVLSGPRSKASVFQTWKDVYAVQHDDGSIDLSTCYGGTSFVRYIPQLQKEPTDGSETVYS